MAQIIFKNVSKKYNNGVVVVKNLNLEIKDKEFLVLVGPSGCGKSTILRMIAGLEEITEGEISIDDKIMNDVPPKDRDIAMVFQNYALYPHMSVFENMAFGLKIKKVPIKEIEKRVFEVSEILGLKDLLKRKPNALSGGQRQRVALGRAIVRNPKVFLFDEPLSNLDAKLRVQMRIELTKLHRKLNTTIVYVTHDQVEAMTMGSRIVVLKDGEVQQVDTSINLYENPQTKFVSEFIGSPSINLIDGRLINLKSKYYFLDAKQNLKIELNKNLKFKLSKKVYLGVRPENILTKSVNKNKLFKLTGVIDVIEMLGNEQIIYFSSNNIQLVSRTQNINSSLMVGMKKNFYIDLSKIHLFSKEGSKLNFS